MPRLPDKTALGALPEVAVRAPAQIPMGTPDPSGLALETLGTGIRQISGVIKKKQDEADEYEIQKALVDFDLEQEKKLDDAQRAAAPDGRDFTAGYRQSYDQDARRLMARIPGYMQPKVDEILVKRGANYEKRAYDFELRTRDKFHVDDVDARLSEIHNDTMAVPDRHGDNAQRGVAIIRASRLPERIKLQAERRFLDRNEELSIRSLAEKYAAEGKDVTKIIEDLRKVPRGSWRRGALEPQSGTPQESTIDIIKKFEGDKDNGWDVRQYSGPYGVKRGATERLTLEEADRRLRVEVAEVEKALDEKIKVPLADSQRAALVSLFYNIGTGKGRVDQVARMINAGELDKVPAWIRQYERDSDGKRLEGLVRRRAEEADLFRRATPLGAMPDGKIERTDLPAIDDPKAPKPAASPSGDMPKLGDNPIDATAMDEPFEADDVPYKHLSPTTRRKLINVLRTNERSQMTTQLTSEIELIRLGRAPKTDEAGRTLLDRARAIMPPVQFRKIHEAWTEAELERQAIAPLRGMPIEQMEDHAVGIFRRAEENEDSLRVAAKVRAKAEREIEKIAKLRRTDPVRAVEGYTGEETDERRPALRHTALAMRAVKDNLDVVVLEDGTRAPLGRPRTPKEKWDVLFEARLRDQQEIMPDAPGKYRIISRREATKFLGLDKDVAKLDPGAYEKKLMEAADRAERLFGPKWAKQALRDAIAFHLPDGDQEHQQKKADVLRKMVQGEPLLAGDLSRLYQLERLSQNGLNFDRSSLNFGSDAMFNLDQLGRSSQIPLAPMGDPGRPAIGQTYQPSARQQDWLRQNPDGWEVFDQKFGKGAAAIVLGSDTGNAGAQRGAKLFEKPGETARVVRGGDDPWGGKRQSVPKARPSSPEALAAQAVKPKDKGWFAR